jgi:hypothetical protein
MKPAQAGVGHVSYNSLAALRFEVQKADPALDAAYNVDSQVHSILQLMMSPRETLKAARK